MGERPLGQDAQAARVATACVCHVTHSANQNVRTTAYVALAFDTERNDPDAMHDPAANTRITIQAAGEYMLQGNIEFAANTTGRRGVRVRKNGATVLAQLEVPAVVNAALAIGLPANSVYLAAGDYLELEAFQNSGGDLNVLASPEYSPEFGVVRVA